MVWGVSGRLSLGGRAGGTRFHMVSPAPPHPGDTLIDGGEHYWEVRYEPDSKAFGVGVAYRSLGRFDQLGKTAASWCLHVNNWLQVSFTAKHANKAKVLEAPVPDSLGVHCDFHQGEPGPQLASASPSSSLDRKPLLTGPPVALPSTPGLLSFYNARTKQLLHTFKAKFTQPLLPAFTVRPRPPARLTGAGGAGCRALRLSLPAPLPVPQVWCGSFQVTTGLQVPSSVRCLQKRGSATSSSNTSLT